MRRGLSLFVLGVLAVGRTRCRCVRAGRRSEPQRRRPPRSRVTVSASEFKFVLSKRSVPVGSKVIFTVINKGKISHDFRILGTSLSTRTKVLNPGQRATLTVTFKKKGRYTYICTLPGHAKLGMKGVFSVRREAAGDQARDDDDDPDHRPSRHRRRRPGRSVAPTRPSRSACSSTTSSSRRHHPVGPGHLRDHEQGERGAQLRDRRQEGRRAPRRLAERRRGRSGCRPGPTRTSATSPSMSTAA